MSDAPPAWLWSTPRMTGPALTVFVQALRIGLHPLPGTLDKVVYKCDVACDGERPATTAGLLALGLLVRYDRATATLRIRRPALPARVEAQVGADGSGPAAVVVALGSPALAAAARALAARAGCAWMGGRSTDSVATCLTVPASAWTAGTGTTGLSLALAAASVQSAVATSSFLAVPVRVFVRSAAGPAATDMGAFWVRGMRSPTSCTLTRAELRRHGPPPAAAPAVTTTTAATTTPAAATTTTAVPTTTAATPTPTPTTTPTTTTTTNPNPNPNANPANRTTNMPPPAAPPTAATTATAFLGPHRPEAPLWFPATTAAQATAAPAAAAAANPTNTSLADFCLKHDLPPEIATGYANAYVKREEDAAAAAAAAAAAPVCYRYYARSSSSYYYSTN